MFILYASAKNETFQVQFIQECLELSDARGFKVDSVEKFQGDERKAIIISTVRSSNGLGMVNIFLTLILVMYSKGTWTSEILDFHKAFVHFCMVSNLLLFSISKESEIIFFNVNNLCILHAQHICYKAHMGGFLSTARYST